MPDNIKVEFIDDDNRAFKMRTVKKNDSLGVFVAEMKYGRGWDIKLR